MGYLMFFGCLFIALAPPTAIFTLVIAKSPRLIILTIGSSFFWLLSILLASIWWKIIAPLQNNYYWIIPWSVLFQEITRFGFYKLYTRAEKGFVAQRTQQTAHLTTHPDELMASLALGLGIGITHSMISYITVMWESSGPAAAFSPACPSVNLFLTSALLSLCFILMNVFWTIISFDGFRRRSWMKMGGVVLSHLVASFLSLLNLQGGSCYASIILEYGLLAILGIVTWIIVVRTYRRPISSVHPSTTFKNREET